MVRIPVERKTPLAFPLPWSGGVRLEPIESRVLEGNPLGDPVRRDVAVYLPPSGKTEGLPLVVYLSGYTGAGWMEAARERYLAESMIRLFDRLVRTKRCGEAVLIAPDCLTTLGGSQYVNSSATGRYEDYVADEVIPWARERFRTAATGVLGQSSGGFGALHLAMNRTELFAAAGSSAGDAAFEYCYLPDFPRAVRACRAAGGAEEFLARLLEDPMVLRGGPQEPSWAALNALAMAACYSPSPTRPGAFELPFDIESGDLVPQVWDRWLSFDPVRRLSDPKVQRRLKMLKSLHVTGSRSDEWALDIGARIFAKRAKEVGVPVTHQEFDGTHGDRRPRFEALYAQMVAALAGHPAQ
jgi:enterochelin esterase family protein